ncbi:ABC transporter ATP-binding protein, partial [Clostridium perfringens]|nr:ABC transporter ATP-binding protein [Clostridium perfringens]
MIQIKNISVFYESKERVKALESVSFKAESDDICAIIGPSGCGKT